MSSVIVVKHGFRRAVIAAGLRGAPGSGGGGSAGVSSFNTRTGTVTLTGADVTGALGYTPANNASLAAVAFTGAYSALSGKPFIPAAPGDIGAASAAQGALADTAVQPAALTVLLDLKVDKIAGYGLSQENFTPAEKAKLAGLDGPLWKGTYTSLAALQSAHPTAEAGSSAHVDAGVGDPVKVYNWDASDGEWVAGGGDAAPITAAQVRTLYESNPDTNAFTDAEKSKLGGVAAGATANANTDSLAESATPTNKWFTVARVLAATLGGLSLAAGGPVLDTDSVLAGFGKLQRQINDLTTALGGKQATLVSGTNIKTINGESLVGPGNVTVSGGASLPVVQALSSSRTLALADAKTFNFNSSASAYTATIPAQAAVAWDADTEIHFLRSGSGAITITAAAGVSINGVIGASVTLTVQHGAVTLKRLGLDDWWLGGLTSVVYGRDNVLGVVSQSGGVPTGAIIERGSNANGSYIRWADGTQICMFSSGAITIQCTAAVGGSTPYYAGLTYTFPAAFVAPPEATARGRQPANASIFAVADCTTTAINMFVNSGTNASITNCTAGYIAIGRWF